MKIDLFSNTIVDFAFQITEHLLEIKKNFDGVSHLPQFFDGKTSTAKMINVCLI